MIKLQQITWDMFGEFKNLEVDESQRQYVTTSLFSLAEAYMNVSNKISDAIINVIYDDKAMIGYVLIYYKKDGENSYYDLHRYMIDQHFQGKGYGKKSFQVIMEYIKTLPLGIAKKVILEYMPKNEVAKYIYHSYGFQDTEEYNRFGEVKTEYYL